MAVVSVAAPARSLSPIQTLVVTIRRSLLRTAIAGYGVGGL